MFVSQILTKKIVVKPSDIRLKRGSDLSRDTLIDTILINKVKDMYGDRCSSVGFLDKDSIKLLERTLGKIYAEHLNGDIIYDVKFTVDVCNPIKGSEITAVVENVNKMGIMAKIKPLTIVLARQHHVNRKCFKNIKVGQEITFTVVGSRFELNDTEISVIGNLSNDEYDEETSHDDSELDISEVDASTIDTEGDSELF